jgi:hypothetical protein
MAPEPRFKTPDLLIDRALTALEANRAVFVIGSALHLPLGGQPGVPGAWAMVDLVRQALTHPNPKRQARWQAQLDAALDGQNDYQAAFRTLIDLRGADAADAVIRQAVCLARLAPSASDPAGLEHDLAGWHLTPGAEALGHLLAAHPSTPVLTTNFDPLIEVAVRRAGGTCHTSTLHVDGDLHQVHAPGSTHVVHVHGFWQGQTLHTALQLTQPRPRLRQSLQRLFRDRVVIVLGYGGWDDGIVRALHDLAHDAQARTDVLWAFYERDPQAIRSKYAHVFQTLAPAPIERVVPYAGVDVQALLPALWAELGHPLITPAPAAHLTHAEIQQVLQAATTSRLFDKRGTLLASLPAAVVAHLLGDGTPIEKLSTDLHALNDPSLSTPDGPPLALWLDVAAFLTLHASAKALFTALATRIRNA